MGIFIKVYSLILKVVTRNKIYLTVDHNAIEIDEGLKRAL